MTLFLITCSWEFPIKALWNRLYVWEQTEAETETFVVCVYF